MSTSDDLTIRKRGAKVNNRQKKMLLQLMVENPLINARKITSEFTINHHKAFWENITIILNVFGPPRKNVEAWKKAWKDLRRRYRKVGTDLKELVANFKGENVNTRLLLGKVDGLQTTTKGKSDIEQILRESLFGEGSTQHIQSDPRSTMVNKFGEIDGEVKLGLDIVMDIGDESEPKEKLECNELCEIAYEEISGSDIECNYSDSHIATDKKCSDIKSPSGLSKNGALSSNESDSDIERYNLRKRLKLSSENRKNATESKKNDIEGETSDSQSSVLNELLLEFRQHNKIQKEKLALKKSHFEQKKRLLEQTLSTKKEIAKAHLMLAKSVKTFVDNISFNT